MRIRLLVVMLLCGLTASVVFATDFAVIVHPSNPVKGVAAADLGKIFKGKLAIWPSGRSIMLVLPDPNSPSMKFVVEKALGTSAEEARRMMTDAARKGALPIVFAANDEAVVKIVETNPAAIGIVDVYNITGGVKVIKIDDKEPFDPGYVLKAH